MASLTKQSFLGNSVDSTVDSTIYNAVSSAVDSAVYSAVYSIIKSIMKPAAKFELATSLYIAGLLCGCCEYDEIWDENEYIYIKELRHKPVCDGRIKLMVLITETE